MAEEAVDPLAVHTEVLNLGSRGSFSFRELTVEENDMCRSAAMVKDDISTFNGRTMVRMMIVTSAVDPKITLDLLAKMPQRVYAQIVEFVNNLNDAASLDQEKVDPKAS